MRVVSGLGLFLVLGGLAAAAQTGPQSAVSGTLLVDAANPRAASPACPLNMRVRQRAGGTLVSTDERGRRVETFAARLKLELKDERPDRSGQRMIAARVSVRGWAPRERILPLDTSKDRDGNLVKTMTVPLSGGGLRDASADLMLAGFTAARMVRLESITLDDGSVWNFRSCEVAPDLYMPVDGSD